MAQSVGGLTTDEERLAELGYEQELVVGVWWLVSARHTFTGPVRTVEFDEGPGITSETPTRVG